MTAPWFKKKNRSGEQQDADYMDMELNRIARRAYAIGGDHWKKVARAIDSVRGLIQQRMHPDDRDYE